MVQCVAVAFTCHCFVRTNFCGSREALRHVDLSPARTYQHAGLIVVCAEPSWDHPYLLLVRLTVGMPISPA
jgi:hypothetical protein